MRRRSALCGSRTLIWPERQIPYIDPLDIAEVAGRLFLASHRRNVGQFHTMNNGQDILKFRQVAEIMSEIWGEAIAYDGSQDAFFREYASMGTSRLQFLWNFFEYERENEEVSARNDFVARIIGRQPTPVRDWLTRNPILRAG